MNIEIRCAYPTELLLDNVRKNVLTHTEWVGQRPDTGGHAVLVGGGPSLADYLDNIKKRQAHGQTIFALNGACRFLNDNGIVPEYQVFLDANKEMGDRVGEAGQYLVSSQCAPELLAALPKHKVLLWHSLTPGIEDCLPDNPADYMLIGGGGTVGLTSMPLAYVMGFRHLHLFGYDSSNRAGKDHAYAVPVTEERIGGEILNSVKVTYGDKVFESTLSMTRQAEMFPLVCNGLIDNGCTITVDVDPNSLLAAVMQDVNSNPAAEAA